MIVPTYFTDSQRQSSKDARTISGLNVYRVNNEPTSTVIVYRLDIKDKENNILVFVHRGETFDVSLVNLDSGFLEVISTNEGTH